MPARKAKTEILVNQAVESGNSDNWMQDLHSGATAWSLLGRSATLSLGLG
jgi:hypothetical protein